MRPHQHAKDGKKIVRKMEGAEVTTTYCKGDTRREMKAMVPAGSTDRDHHRGLTGGQRGRGGDSKNIVRVEHGQSVPMMTRWNIKMQFDSQVPLIVALPPKSGTPRNAACLRDVGQQKG